MIPPVGNKGKFLHESYTSVPAVVLKTSATVVPKCLLKPAGTITCLNMARDKKIAWIEHAQLIVDKENITSQDVRAWAAYHASQPRQLPLDDDLPCPSSSLL